LVLEYKAEAHLEETIPFAARSSPYPPDWSRKIEVFRRNLNLTQSELGRKIRASAMAISRWERGLSKPPADAHIRLGSLAGDPLCWFFWGRAGLSTSDLTRVLPGAHLRLAEDRIATVRVVQAGAGSTNLLGPTDFVAIPILPVHIATPDANGDEVADLEQLKAEAMWAAPAEWCPNLKATISLPVKGNSMSPLILDGYIIAVDTSVVSRDVLIGKIVVAWNAEDKRLLLSRLIRFDHTDALVSDQRENRSVSVANGSSWRIIGKILWWAGKTN